VNECKPLVVGGQQGMVQLFDMASRSILRVGPGPADTLRHVILCRSTQETRDQNAFGDVASQYPPVPALGSSRCTRAPYEP